MYKALKAAIPTIVLTGGGIASGYQLIMILAGAGMVLEHRLAHGKWWDKDKQICHGKFGGYCIVAGCFVSLISLIGIL